MDRSDTQRITALMRPRCRIPIGTPSETGDNWQEQPVTLLLQDHAVAKGLPQPPPTQVRAMADDRALFLRFFQTRVDTTRPGSQGSAESDRAWLRIHPRNDPVERYCFEADIQGATAAFQEKRVNGERRPGAASDPWSHSEPAVVEWRSRCGARLDARWVEMEIPWPSIGLDRRPAVVGFACGVQGGPTNDASWPDTKRDSTCDPCLEPGELLIGFDAGTPSAVELDPPRFGKNFGRLVFATQWFKRPARFTIRTESSDGTLLDEHEYPIGSPPRPVEFEYWLERNLCSHLDLFGSQRLALEIRAADGTALYSARLPMDRHLGICIDEPYSEPARIEPIENRGNTRRELMIRQIARKLPRLHRDHAGHLAREDGTVAVYLREESAWGTLAEMVEKNCFSTESRLIGALLLVGQKSVTNLFRGASSDDNTLDPFTVLRQGGGPSVARAAVLARLLQHVRDPSTNQPFVTRRVPPPQGVPIGAVAVEYGGDHTILDPTTLAVFYRNDGKLAVLDEILAKDAVRAEGAGKLASAFAALDAEAIRRAPADGR